MAKEKSTKQKLITPVFRLSFPHLDKPHAFKDGKPKFQVQAIWDIKKFSDADKDRWRAMKAGLDRVSLDKLKKVPKDFPPNYKQAIRDGSEKEDMEGYEGKKFATLSSSTRPGAVDNVKDDDGKWISIDLIEDSDRFYPGCYCRATINPYAYTEGSKGAALGLQNIQFVKDGARLDSRTNAEDDFDEEMDSQWISEDDDEDDRPKKKKKSRDEDDEDEDRPKKKKSSRDDEDDEDDRPKKKSRRDEDDEDEDDEDDRPKKKKSKREDDDDDDF